MLLPNDDIDWHGLWASLLQGAGAGLLHHDGSRLAQAALMGLEAFDAAQERQRRSKADEPEAGMEDGEERSLSLPWPDMSAAELAAFLRLGREDKDAFQQEARDAGLGADLADDAYRPVPHGTDGWLGDLWPRTAPMPFRRHPRSASPFGGWPLEGILPLGRDGGLNMPTLRR